MMKIPWRSTLVIQWDPVRFDGGHLVAPNQSEFTIKNNNQLERPNSRMKPVQEVIMNQSKLFNNNIELVSKNASNDYDSSIFSAIIPKFMINFSYITCHRS